MLKILLQENREALKGEYIFRILNLFLLSIVFILVYLDILIYSINIFISTDRDFAVEEYNRNQNVSDKRTQDEIKEKWQHIDLEFNLFDRPAVKSSEILEKIIKNKNANIMIGSINFISDTSAIEISGVSKNREGIINFSKSFENDGAFSGIEVPFSSLTKNSDIPFTIKMKLVKNDNAK